jgi:YD repeat-containing protein
MRRSTPLLIGTVVCLAALLSGSCSLIPSAPVQTKYKIVDKASGRLRAVYTLNDGERRPSRIDSYNSRQQLARSYDLSYDAEGRLSRKVTTITTVAAPLTSQTTYSYVDTFDSSGRLSSTTQTSSEGKVTSTYFGYDEAGKARGVVEKTGSSVLAKDYAQ